MAGPMNNVEIEDVLSSIRRLVSEEGRGMKRTANPATDMSSLPTDTPAAANDDVRATALRQTEKSKGASAVIDADKLVLSPAFRIPDADSINSPESRIVPSSDLASLEATIAELEAAVGAPPTNAETISATAAIAGLDLPAEDWTDTSDFAGLPDTEGLSRVPAFVSRQGKAFDPARFDAVAFDHAAAQTLFEGEPTPVATSADLEAEDAELAADRAFAEQAALEAAFPAEDEAGFEIADHEQVAAQVYDFAAHAEAKAQAVAEVTAGQQAAGQEIPAVSALDPEGVGGDEFSVYDSDNADFVVEEIAANDSSAADFLSDGDDFVSDFPEDVAETGWHSTSADSDERDAASTAISAVTPPAEDDDRAPSQLDLAAERAAAAEPPLRGGVAAAPVGSRTPDADAFAWSAGQGLVSSVAGIAASLIARNRVVPAPGSEATQATADVAPASADAAISAGPHETSDDAALLAEAADRPDADFADFAPADQLYEDVSPAAEETATLDAGPQETKILDLETGEAVSDQVPVMQADRPSESGQPGVVSDAEPPEDDQFSVFEEEETIIDEAALRALIATIIREELQGELGERITRNVRKLVRQEIQRALDAKGMV